MTLYTDNANGGVDIDLPDNGQTKWLLENGYIGKKKTGVKDEERGKYATSAPASDDPTLAVNREAPVPTSKLAPHLANEGVDQNEGAETVLGKDRGLEAKVSETAPKAKFTSHAKAGQDTSVDNDVSNSSLKDAIDKQQGQPAEPKIGKMPRDEEIESATLKDAIDKGTEDVTTGSPRR